MLPCSSTLAKKRNDRYHQCRWPCRQVSNILLTLSDPDAVRLTKRVRKKCSCGTNGLGALGSGTAGSPLPTVPGEAPSCYQQLRQPLSLQIPQRRVQTHGCKEPLEIIGPNPALYRCEKPRLRKKTGLVHNQQRVMASSGMDSQDQGYKA